MLLLPGVAHAGRVVVLDFDGGKRAASARLDLVRGLLAEDGVTLVPERDYAERASQAGVGRSELATGSGIRRAAAAAAVEGVITGRVQRKGRRWVVRIRLFDSLGEALLDRDYLLVNGRKMRKADVGRIARFVANKTRTALPEPALAEAPPPAPTYAPEPAPEPTPAPPPEPPPPAADWGSPPASGAPSWTAPPETDRAPPPADDWARPSPPAKTVSPAGKPPLFSMNLVASAGRRTFLLEGDETTIRYETGSAYPEIGVLAEVSPLRDSGPWLEGLGLEVVFFHAFVSSALGDLGDLVLSTPVTRWHLDARYRVRILASSPWSPSLGLRAGFGSNEFTVQQANPRFTSIHHDGLRVGFEASQPLMPRVLRLEAAFVLVPSANPGPAERQAYGDEVTSSGWALRAGIAGDSGREGGKVTWGLWVLASHYGDEYTGTGLRDANVTAAEDYLSFMAGFGWAF